MTAAAGESGALDFAGRCGDAFAGERCGIRGVGSWVFRLLVLLELSVLWAGIVETNCHKN